MRHRAPVARRDDDVKGGTFGSGGAHETLEFQRHLELAAPRPDELQNVRKSVVCDLRCLP